ncbi:MAG TPA: hypothetical protein VGB07_06930 [Blastocatellia bacterium]
MSETSEPAPATLVPKAGGKGVTVAEFTLRFAAACRQFMTLAPTRQRATSAINAVRRVARRHILLKYLRPAIVIQTPFSMARRFCRFASWAMRVATKDDLYNQQPERLLSHFNKAISQ